MAYSVAVDPLPDEPDWYSDYVYISCEGLAGETDSEDAFGIVDLAEAECL